MKKKFYCTFSAKSADDFEWNETFNKIEDAIEDAMGCAEDGTDYIVFECKAVRHVIASKPTVKTIKS